MQWLRWSFCTADYASLHFSVFIIATVLSLVISFDVSVFFAFFCVFPVPSDLEYWRLKDRNLLQIPSLTLLDGGSQLEYAGLAGSYLHEPIKPTRVPLSKAPSCVKTQRNVRDTVMGHR